MFDKKFVPEKPFSDFKWKWACLQCTEGLNDPVILLGVLFRMRKLELLNKGIKYSSDEFARELIELSKDTEESVGVDLARRTGERNLIRNSGQYWRALNLIVPGGRSGKIELTDFGRRVADRDISQTEFAAITVQTFRLPNPQVQSSEECELWLKHGLIIYPLKLILEIVCELLKHGEGYLTTEELAVLSSTYFSVQTRKQYIDSLSPLLSFRLYEKSGYLFLRIENTGQSEATEISLTFKELSNNGEQNKFELDEILKSKLTLYPNETVTGGICRSGRNIVTSIAPVIKIEVSYIKGNTKEKIQFFRCICYTGTNDENVFMKCELEDISRKLNEISCSSNRMANYFEGRFFLKSDVINAYPSSSMYKDLKDAINKTEREEIKENTRDELGNLHIE